MDTIKAFLAGKSEEKQFAELTDQEVYNLVYTRHKTEKEMGVEIMELNEFTCSGANTARGGSTTQRRQTVRKRVLALIQSTGLTLNERYNKNVRTRGAKKALYCPYS